MITLFVTYPGDSNTRFDREYYVQKHLPLVRSVWAPHGLLTLSAFFPGDSGNGIICICACGFRDEAALQSALNDAGTEGVMSDVSNFTSASPAQFVGRELQEER